MSKPKTIYALKGIFSKFLEDSDKISFLIPTYQRGYKWTSTDEDSQVVVLMRDLYTAFEKNTDRYYLQFITLKGNNNNLEVIDGQQRLVTLTIIFSLLFNFEELQGEDNFVRGKLIYQIRDNFIKKYIYENINLILESEEWDAFILDDPDNNNQDVFYIYHATKAIYDFLKNVDKQNFYHYLCDKTLLIVNLLDVNMNSEKIFINVNKGVILKDEDLVKGLLITKIPLDNQDQKYRLAETEINEVRANLGRQWDDLTHWVSQENIRQFYKIECDENNRLSWLIQLAYPDVENNGKSNPIFSYLDELHRDKKQTATEIFRKIRKTMLTLNDWFYEPELHNLLGYILHARNSNELRNVWNKLNPLSNKQDILKKLKSICINLLPLDESKEKLNKELNYSDHKQDLFNLFLAIDVAKFLPIINHKAVSYDFSKITLDNWSIEHIFPQNEKDLKQIDVLGKFDLKMLKEVLSEDIGKMDIEYESKTETILALYNKIQQNDTEFEIDNEELEALGYLLENKASDLHKLGNLALLPQGINCSLSNHFFDRKRKIIVEKVSAGDFVPFHTYDVFSKLIIENQTSLHVWSRADILKHEEYINNQMTNIMYYLNPKD